MFDPSITVFDKYNEYDIIDGLRTAVIDLALKNTRTLFEILYLKHVSHPYLFAEITHRIIRNPNLVVDSINIPIFSRALMCASMYYQPLHYPDEQNTSVQITLSIEAARTSIFLFISQLMSISPESPSLFYSNQIFVSFFLSFLFETPLRSFILSNLLNFLSRQEIISEPLIDMLVQIIQICSPLFPEEKFVVLVFDIIQTLTDVLIHQRSITKYFEPLCAPIFLSLNSLIQSELAHNYILQCVQFFALTAFTQTVNFPQIAALEKAIQTVYGTNIPQQLINRLIQMMAGEILATLTPSFIIHQPKVLKLFVKISLDDSHFLESINFVDQLCQFSALNCQRCRWCDFDLFLIDLIKEREEPKIVSALLNLFQHIASSISSVSVVQRYISLLSPKDGRKIHVNMPYYLNTMNNIISTAARLPVVSIPLTKNSAVVDIQGVTAADLENGFTFVFWIYVDTTNAQYKPSIFHLSDSKGNKIFCFLSSAFLFFNQRSATFESNGKIDVQLPIQQWSFVSVTYKRIDEEDTEIRTTFGCKKMKVLEFLTMPLQPGQISCQIGGVTPDSLQSDTFTRLGSFGLFRELTIEEITAISELGPRPTGNLITQPLFFYNIDEFKGSLILQTKASSPGVESRISKSSISFNNTFSDILINYCKVEILLPLFSLLDLKMNDGNIFKNAVKYAVEIIGNTLMISNRAQEGFLRANGFAIISHLLLSASPKHIDYNLYYQFFTLMQSFTNTKLQESIAKNILLNEDIWIHSDSDSHLRILKHWSRVLIPSLKSFSSTYPRNSEKSETDLNENDDSLRISFQDILYIMRVYYWYEPVTEEKDYIKLNRSYDLNVYECRQQMNHIALMLANERFTSNDYLCLASHIFTCAENKQVIDLLVLLKELALSSNHVLFGISSSVDLIFYLYSLFIKNDEDIIVLVIENIIILHHSGLFGNDSLLNHIFKIQERFTPKMSTESILRKLTDIMINENLYELLPVCSFIALNLDESVIDWFISILDPKKNYYSIHFSWCLWPVVLIYQCTLFIQEKMLEFLVKAPVEQWETIFAMIYNVGLILDEDISPKLSIFLTLMGHDERLNETNASIFFKLSAFLIFLRTVPTDYTALDFEMKKSQFFGRPQPIRSPSVNVIKDNLNSKNNSPINQIKTGFPSRSMSENITLQPKSYSLDIQALILECRQPKDIINKIVSFAIPMPPSRFGLRFDSLGNWDDYEIAQMFMNLYSMFRTPEYFELDLMISAYISRYDIKFAHAHLLRLNIRQEDFKDNTYALDFVNHHLLLLDRQSLLIFINSTNNTNKNNSEVRISDNMIKEIEYGAFQFIHEQVALKPLDVNRMCMNFLVKMKDLSKNSISKQYMNTPADLLSSYAQLTKGLMKNKNILLDNNRSWMKLWRCLAIDNAPWDCNTQGEAHFKRDNTLCTTNFCPFKIKRNWKFDDHKDASIENSPEFIDEDNELSESSACDTASVTRITQVMQEDLKNRASKYQKKAPMPLLEISDSDITLVSYIRQNEEDNISYLKRAILDAPMEYIKPTTTTTHEELGTFYLTKDFIKLTFKDEKRASKVIPLTDVLHAFLRRSYHMPNSIEIITTNGKSYYIHFQVHNSLTILKKLASLQPPNAVCIQTTNFYHFFLEHSKTDMWVHDQISNFEYLMHLNMMSGRTFNDLTQYPIFPWVLGDFTSKNCSLSSNYMRDLRKPIGAIGQERLDHLIKEFKNVSYMYDNGNINIANACQYLVRLEPFTTEHICINKGKFGQNFLSIQETFTSATTVLHDYREMIPEFFFMPEFLLNLNHYNLASKNSSSGDVILPPWAKTADEFIYLQRKALESDYVSNTLHHWIDLIWGIKQKGQEAISSMNVYLPEMYEDIWSDPENLNDPNRRAHIESTLLCIGQVPPQLFKSHHPSKKLTKEFPAILKQPSIIAPHSNGQVAVARVEVSSIYKCKVILITDDGTMIAHYADFSCLKAVGKLTNDHSMNEYLNNKFNRRLSQSKLSSSLNTLANSLLNSNPNSSFNNEYSNGNSKLSGSSKTLTSSISDQNLHLQDLQSNNMTFSIKEIPNFSNYKVDIFSHFNCIAQLYNGRIACISNLTNKVVLVDIRNGQIEEIPNQVSEAVAIAASGDLLAIACNDAVLNIFKNNNFSQPFMSMPSYRDSISCCCISQLFFVAVIGTRDGSLIINSLNKGSTVRVINLRSARPCMVTITPSWGFIVVYTTKLKKGILSHYLYVFNINGIKLRKKKLSFEIIAWSHCSSNQGFDYMFISDSRGKLFEFEVFYLNIGESFFRCHSPVASLSYLKDLFAVVVVTKDGRVIFLPHCLK